MKLKKRKIKFAAIFGLCWFALLVLLVDGILKFQTLVDLFGSYALVEITLLLLVILPTVAVYIFTKEKNPQQSNHMGYREEAIECVKDHVLPIHKQIYAKYGGDFDRIYSEGYNSRSYQGRVIEPGKVYELSYLECSCPKVKKGLRNNPEQCECSRQSILYILSQLEPDSQFDVRIENTILRGSDRCTFRITRRAGMETYDCHLAEQSSGPQKS